MRLYGVVFSIPGILLCRFSCAIALMECLTLFALLDSVLGIWIVFLSNAHAENYYSMILILCLYTLPSWVCFFGC